jgi:uncharacterized protein
LEFADYIVVFFAGCIGGMIAGLLGLGGGVIYVVVLSHYFTKLNIQNIEIVRFILSNSFFAIFFASIFGSLQQIRKKNFFFKEVSATAITAMTAMLFISILILKYDWYSKEAFSLFFTMVLFLFMLRMILSLRKNKTKKFKESLNIRIFPPLGFLMGTFSALSGLGGGVITVPILSDIYKLKIKKATSISLGVMPFMALTSSLIYAFLKSGKGPDASLGYIMPQIVLPLVAGVILCAPLGVKLAFALKEIIIRIIFIIVLSLIILKTILSLL